MEPNEFLRKVSLFSNLEEDAISLIARTAIRKEYHADEVVVWEKDPADQFFVIESGSVAVTKMTADGKEILLTRLTRGAFFGEMALLIDEPRTATVTTLEPSVLLTVYRRDFLRILHQEPEVAASILKEVCSRLAHANTLIESLLSLDVCGRLARYLITLAEKEGQPKDDGTVEIIRPKQMLIAQSIGTSRETVSRMLKELQRQGLIRIEGKHIFLNAAELERE